MPLEHTLVAGVVLLAACAQPPTEGLALGEDAVRDTVTALFSACVEQERVGNPDVCLGQMSRDSDFRYLVGTTVSSNADSIAARTRRGFANREVWEMEVEIDTVAVLSSEAAVVTARLRVTTKDRDGPLLVRPAGWSLVYVHRGSGWSVIQGHWTYGDPETP